MTNSPALSSPSVLQSLWWSELDRANMTQADGDAAKTLMAGVAAIHDVLDAAGSRINQNGDLAAQGRVAALLAASTRGLDQLAATTTPTLAALDYKIVAHARALRRAAAGPDASAVTELRAIESRAAFATNAPLLQPMKYLDLCASGTDGAACAAVENAGGFAPLLAADVIEQGRAIRGARALPDQAHALDIAQDLRALLAASVAAARRNLTFGMTGDPFQMANQTAAELADEA